jgi:folate-dependent phosphoribosylglycinamide formyltransferase PurN
VKLEFEEAVLAVAQGVRADVVVSDHYMARIENLHRWMPGRVLNIHPAVTLPGHPCRFVGKSPTADALAHARANGGQALTGATLHWVDDEIDHGPPVAFSADTPVFAVDEPMWLRYRNYQHGKLPVLVQGLHHYATRLFPYLNELDLNQLAEL